MDSRTAAHVLDRIGGLLDLAGAGRFQARAYRLAADAVLALGEDDLSAKLRDGSLAAVPGVGPATLAVLRELVETGESSMLERLRETVPEGLLEVVRVPGLTSAKVRTIHELLDVRSLDDLEAAIDDGRLASVRGLGPKTIERIRKGISVVRSTRTLVRLPQAAEEAARLAALVQQHPGVSATEIVGDVRRWCEVVGTIAMVAECTDPPERVLHDLTKASGVRESTLLSPTEGELCFVDGTVLHVACTTSHRCAMTVWRMTGSEQHVARLREYAYTIGYRLDGDVLFDALGQPIHIPTEEALYNALGLPWIPPELREGLGEVVAASAGELPALLTNADIRGVLHCHSTYSDGSATIAEMADGARARGWSYIGITDHSAAAFYAGGLSREQVLRQHEEIDRLNAGYGDGFRILKGIECDILADGTLDYSGYDSDDSVLDRFDYVVGSIHSRFSMTEEAMTERVLRAMDDPRLTILAHPTGRLLLGRAGYAIDLEAVIEKAAACGVVLELNADSHRLDLDWRWCRVASTRGVMLAIGPDAHSVRGLDNVWLGVRMARKGWVGAGGVLNAMSVEEVLGMARERRELLVPGPQRSQ